MTEADKHRIEGFIDKVVGNTNAAIPVPRA